MNDDVSKIGSDPLPTFHSDGENTETDLGKDTPPASAEGGKADRTFWSRDHNASESNLSVSPYLLRPLRTLSQAAEDRRSREDRENDNREKQRRSIICTGLTSSAFTKYSV